MDAVESDLPQAPCSPAHKRGGDNVRYLAMNIIGVFQAIIGVAAVVTSAVWIHKIGSQDTRRYVRNSSLVLSNHADVIWKAVLFLVSGVIGSVASYTKTKMLIISWLICCICSLQLIPWTVVFHINSAIDYNEQCEHPHRCDIIKSLVVIDSFIVVLFFLEIVFTMSGSAICLHLMTSKFPKERKPVSREPEGGYCTISEQADRGYVATCTKVRREEDNTSQLAE